jgi:hypothetical protein
MKRSSPNRHSDAITFESPRFKAYLFYRGKKGGLFTWLKTFKKILNYVVLTGEGVKNVFTSGTLHSKL